MTERATGSPARPRRAGAGSFAQPQLRALEAALRKRVEGEVRFDPGARHLYATDASNYRQVPLGVVVPRDVGDCVATVEVCRDFDVPLTNRGGGTSMAGQATNVAVILDFSRHLRRVLEVNPDDRWARVQPGCVLDDLQARCKPHGLRFGPDPATHNRCTLGGIIGNNSCGAHSIQGGRAADNVIELEVVLADGTRMTVGATDDAQLERVIAAGGHEGRVYRDLRDLRDRYADLIRDRFPDIPRRVSGYNLDALLPEKGFHLGDALTGTESTCVTILEAKVRLIEHPPARRLLVLGYENLIEAADRVEAILPHQPIALEGIDRQLVDNIRDNGSTGPAGGGARGEDLSLLPEGSAYLLVEFGGDSREEAEEHARAVMRDLDLGESRMSIFDSEEQERRIWQIREEGAGTTSRPPGRPLGWPGWEDFAVPPARLASYLRGLRGLFDDYGYQDVALYGHFGDGCVHGRIPFDLRTPQGVARFRSFVEEAADQVVAHGGSLSGEHGDGQARAELLERMFGAELVRAFGEFKAIWDPEGMMNPGKVVDPYRLDENLRLGADYRPWQPRTKFAYPRDDFSFASAQLRCVGVGKCRRDDGAGTMCPSYMVTHEERHSTRGRARLLFEMLQPDAELEGWRDEAVRDALHLCLSCKACKTECPVSVDMATYKAEFLHNHYRGRVKPRSAFALGLIHWWSRAAIRMPGLANAALRSAPVSDLAKRAAGLAPQRDAPAFAAESFVTWFRRRPVRNPTGRRVLLFPDTFTNHFEPEVGKAAVEVLEHAGCQVRLPDRILCCGRPLYEYGMLDLAERQLRQLVASLRDEVSAGTHIIGLEPSCVATFRDELVEMLPHDPDGRRVSEATHTLSEFLVEVADYQPPRLERRAIVHGHCHQKAVMGLRAETRLLDALGLDWRELDAGCCGLAGSFGYEAGERYQVSVKAGERKLLPAVREADDDTLIIVDGFSCRSQIRHLQDRRHPLHLAQVLALAVLEGPRGPSGNGPVETAIKAGPAPAMTRNDWVAVGALGAAGALAVLAVQAEIRRRRAR